MQFTRHTASFVVRRRPQIKPVTNVLTGLNPQTKTSGPFSSGRCSGIICVYQLGCLPRQFLTPRSCVFWKAPSESNLGVRLPHREIGRIFHCYQIVPLSCCAVIYSTPMAEVEKWTAPFIPPQLQYWCALKRGIWDKRVKQSPYHRWPCSESFLRPLTTRLGFDCPTKLRRHIDFIPEHRSCFTRCDDVPWF